MARQDRFDLINSIETETDSRLLSLFAGDRRGMETKIAQDIFPMFHRHLMNIGRQEKISLSLYSVGGITIAGYGLVNLIREFCEEFQVIIPFRALSTATLIALGADSIVMTPMAQLSPIDPSVEHPLGPQVLLPGHTDQRIVPVNVEDVNAYLDLAKREFNLKNEQSLTAAFETLSDNIHPLVLGAVQRSREEIGFLATKLMEYHTPSKHKVKRVVHKLIRERFSHSYIIGRSEAETEFGLNVIQPPESLNNLIIELFNEYNEVTRIDTPVIPEALLGQQDQGVFSFNRAIIEIPGLTYVFRTEKEITRVTIQQPDAPIPIVGYQERLLNEGWLEDNNL